VAAPSPTTMVLLQPLGGAVARAVGGDTPVAHRDAGWVYHALAVWHDPQASDDHIAWARRVGAAMAPFTTAAPYLTYSSDSGEPERVRSTFGDNYERLVAVKDRYDPGNMFRINQNIPPSTEALAQAERGS
jgi:FAD/FMN-containing dehydrogenase